MKKFTKVSWKPLQFANESVKQKDAKGHSSDQTADLSILSRLPRRPTDLRKGASAAVLGAEGTKGRSDAVGLEGLGQVPAVH